jgi:crotonobetainyl-CoA:carnitine CoA-transferase CaiB-like acyl-CoA transferase
MLDASIVMLTSLATPYLITGQMLARTGDTGYSGSPTAGLFAGRDGSRISLGAVQNNQFASLCRVIGRPELTEDPRFATPALRAQPHNAAELRAILDPVFLSRHGAEWEAALNAQGVPCGLVRDIGQACEALRDSGRGLLLQTTAPASASKSPPPAYVNAGFTFAQDGPGVRGSAPEFAEHSREVLQALGYGESDIAELAASGTVRMPP